MRSVNSLQGARVPVCRLLRKLGYLLISLVMSVSTLKADVTFASAVRLALQNSPRIKIAQDDLNHAKAVLSDAKDQFIPSAGATGGVGRSYGITLSVPTIFTINAQSLVFSYSQRDYIRSARAGIEAATMAIADVRSQVEEDTVNTYLALQSAQLRRTAIGQKRGFADKLYGVVQDRLSAGIESELDLKRAHLTAVQIKLQQLSLDDEISSLREHLAELTGVPSNLLTIVPESVPTNFSTALLDHLRDSPSDSFSIRSAEANERARLEQAFGDERFRARPQFLFQAQYGRISPINDVSDYYNLHGRYNTFEAGVLIVLPFLDRSRSARARETMSDAMRAHHDVQNVKGQQAEALLNLQHSILELAMRAELTEVELGIAHDELTIMLARLESRDSTSGRPMTAKDEQNARLDERQKYIDWVDASLQLRRAQVSELRQTGLLDDWFNTVATNGRIPPNGER